MERVDALRSHLKTAGFFISGHQYERAANAARKALLVDPDSDEGHAVLAICAANRGDAAEARREADVALSLSPNEVYNLYASAIAAQCEGNLERAEAEIRRTLVIDPQYHYMHYELGQILRAQERPEEARLSYAEAIRLSPERPAYLLAMAKLCFARGQWQEGEPYLEASLRLDPENAEAQKWLGLRQIKGQQLKTGHQTLRSSLSLNPNDTFVQKFSRYLETLQRPFLKLFVNVQHNERLATGKPDKPWSGLGAKAMVCGFFIPVIRLMDGVSNLLKGALYLILCAMTVLEIYLFVASEIMARDLIDDKGKPTWGTRVKMVFIAASYALMHTLYWWLPTVL